MGWVMKRGLCICGKCGMRKCGKLSPPGFTALSVYTALFLYTALSAVVVVVVERLGENSSQQRDLENATVKVCTIDAVSLDALLAALRAPQLSGALCRGRHQLFDGDDALSQARALRLCRRCPAQAECERWLASLSPSQRPVGVMAGRVLSRDRRATRNRPQLDAGGSTAAPVCDGLGSI
jgi:hypothetical protein